MADYVTRHRSSDGARYCPVNNRSTLTIVRQAQDRLSPTGETASWRLGGLARTILRPPPFDPGLRRGRRAQGRLPVGATPLRLSFPLRSLRETDFRRGGWGESPPPSFGWSLLRQAQDRLSPTGEDRVCRQRPPPARGFTWGAAPDTAPYANGNHLPAATPPSHSSP